MPAGQVWAEAQGAAKTKRINAKSNPRFKVVLRKREETSLQVLSNIIVLLFMKDQR
jgi:hypothetical protein